MNVTTAMTLRMAAHGIRNTLRRKALSVSFEVTHACTANCWHCNLGGPIRETRLGPEQYAAICRELDPVISHISGGEPLARGDVDEIVRAQANPGRLPFMVVVSNASLLTPERFLRLKRAGMHQLSLSIDFPDDRHDAFRRIPGLLDRMARVVPECARIGDRGDVVLNCCLTAWNFREAPAIVRLAERWGVSVNFSAYTPLRVDDAGGLVTDPAQRPALRQAIEDVVALQRAGKPVYTSERVMWRYYRFLTGEKFPGCQAGDRFVVINPDGRLTPCAMVMAYYDDLPAMQRGFSCRNTCAECYISTRAGTEKGVREFIADGFAHFGRLFARGANPSAEASAT
jgi:MoaA/NifB/PqqE/SkfB family radical SAM enzyme